jgi:hypothetical protein
MVFALTPPASAGGSWTEAVIYNFSGKPDGVSPTGLTAGADGTIYGTVEYGGRRNRGGVFALTPPTVAGGAWTEEMLYNFKGRPDAANPVGGLTLGRDGTLFGVSVLGGTASRGTVFRLRPPASPGRRWRESVVYSFQGMPDGQDPSPGLAIGKKGAIYGATLQGGQSAGRCQRAGCGTVFQLTPSSTTGGPMAAQPSRSSRSLSSRSPDQQAAG